MFIPLQTKSDYSLGFGTASPEELAERAAAIGYAAIALTDLGSLAGQVRFHLRCRSLGIRPITGLELRPGLTVNTNAGALKGRIVLIARDLEGYRNLCGIIAARTAPDPAKLVAAHSGGLFALSDDPDMIEFLLSSRGFEPGGLGLLVVRPPISKTGRSSEEEIIRASARLGIPLVASIDAVFLAPSDYPLHLLQSAIRLNRQLSDLGSDQVSDPARWLRARGDSEALFSDLPEALAGARSIGNACTFDLTKLPAPLPSIDLLTGRSAEWRLAELCGRSIKDRLRDGTWTPRHAGRIERELAVIYRMGLPSCFLVIAAIADYCRERGIPAAARGSAVSSLVLNLLGASSVDPVAEGLIFERFLHEGKTDWPDVDLDLPSDRRDEVIKWVYDRFGRDRVAMVAAHHRFQYRSALREGLKALGVQPAHIRRLLDALPPDGLVTEESGGPEFPLGALDISGIPLPDEARHALPLVARLVGRPRYLGLHPAGVLIGSNLGGSLPLDLAAKGVVITQYDATDVAALGFFKIDLLGNHCLSEIEETLRLAGNPHAGRIDEIPPDDPATLRLIDRAETVGCFQLESPAMRSLLSRIPIRSQVDIVAALALIRPGAAAGKAKEKFARRAGAGNDHDVMLFEEDVMRLLSRAGQLSLEEADRLRSAIVNSGGDPAVLDRLKGAFLARAGAKSENAWDAAAKFAAYSFNKAHAASYARLAYLSAYMKAHHPLEFTCALLNHHQGLYPLRTIAAEMVRRGIALFPPDVNRSERASHPEAFDETGRGVRIGLDRVKIVSNRTAGRILKDRLIRGAFANLADLLGRVHIPVREVTALVLSGACDSLAPLGKDGYPFIHEAVIQILREGLSQENFRDISVEFPANDGEGSRQRVYASLVRVMNELRYLEMHVTSHPAAVLRSEADRYGCLPIGEAVLKHEGARVSLLVLLAAMRRVPSERGLIQFMTLEDETGLLEGLVLPPVYEFVDGIIKTPGPYLVKGRIRHDRGAAHCEIESLAPFFERARPYGMVNRNW